MPYITREDGERFVIPSYRDVLITQRKSQLKTEILALSQSYGEYITLQLKGPGQYEVAFSPDTGYLLGESIWQQFKRPIEMIYCEAIPNTNEAILVIVKNGSVYLDGRFPLESIPEELIIFLTQENSFDIYVYGDVTISQTPEEGKFSFDPKAVKSFTVLEKPVFPTLPLLKIYQLDLVNQVLKKQAIGVFPLRQVIIGVVFFIMLWLGWSFMKPEAVEQPKAPPVNPYQGYYDALTSPAPDEEINQFLDALALLYVLPGWRVDKIEYSKGNIVANVSSGGSKIQALADWAKNNNATVDIKADGLYLLMKVPLKTRGMPKNIYQIKAVMEDFVDKLSTVYPGNNIQLNELKIKGVYTDATISIRLNAVSPVMLRLIGTQMKDLPFVLQNMSLRVENGSISGSINIDAVGN